MDSLLQNDIVDINHHSHLYLYLRLMQLWGLWPYKSKRSIVTLLHWVYSKVLMIFLLIISIQQLLQMTISPDLENISAAIDVASLTLAALYRQMLFTFYINDFKNIVDKVDSNFQQNQLPYNVKFDTKKWLSNSHLYTYIYLFLPILIIIAWVTSRNIDNIKITKELQKVSAMPLDLGNLTSGELTILNTSHNFLLEEEITNYAKPNVKRRLPVNCWYPYDSGVSPAFEIAFVWETSMAAVCGMAYVISDAFLFMIIYLVCGQLEILKTSLKALDEDHKKFKESERNLTAVQVLNRGKKVAAQFCYPLNVDMKQKYNKAIFKIIDYHNNILEIIHDLDLSLRSMIVVDFLHAVVSLSFAMLQTIIANSFYEWIQMLLFIGVCILHQFLNNLFCEILIQQQETVAEAAYNTPWVEGSDTFKTSVYMTMVQARCPTRLSGWKMYVLGLSTFVDFMKLLASYFLVLQSLHAEESTSTN